ncbi:MAG: CHAT domain-containing protein [Leptolyngbyaceae cyanobacterium bins.349]|nr:CHAT domain-containing protein [Leptolyngbyaceae cyanobacterium bins.349]
MAGTYRRLADLLLSQGRVLEAQQVLELLKIQELRDYTRNTRAGGTTSGIDFDATERKILQAYNTLIDFGQKIRDCQSRKVPCTDTELTQLVQLRTEQTQAIQQILKTLEAELAKRTEQDKNALDPKNDLSRKAQELIAAQPDTVLIYSLVTDDRLWVVLASEADVLRKFEVKVSQKQLTNAVLKFRQLMKACESRTCGSTDVKPVQKVSQQLYNWLLPPELRQELQGKGSRQRPIRNLVFAPDRVTRYIPSAALFDGKNYLIENYAVSTIVSAKLTDTRDRLPTNPQEVSVLALGLSNPVPPEYGALPHVPVELDEIVKQTGGDPNGTFSGLKRLNQEFDWLTLQKNLYGHKILHLATHGKFVPGSFEASYLLLGTGKPLPIPQIEQLSDLVGVHLVVLSACETALGGKREQDGLEIAGISNSFLERGAKSVLASLWQVSDASTSRLMQRFYQNLATGKMTKAEALRQAQQWFIADKTQASTATNPRSSVQFKPGQNQATTLLSDRSHPYYWAPFILIGNGL